MKRNLIGILAVTLLTFFFSGLEAKGKTVLDGVLNINAASAEELMQLPGIGKSKAEAIVAFRQSHPFKSVGELAEVKGIGPKMMEKIQGYLAVEGVTTLKEVSPPVAQP